MAWCSRRATTTGDAMVIPRRTGQFPLRGGPGSRIWEQNMDPGLKLVDQTAGRQGGPASPLCDRPGARDRQPGWLRPCARRSGGWAAHPQLAVMRVSWHGWQRHGEGGAQSRSRRNEWRPRRGCLRRGQGALAAGVARGSVVCCRVAMMKLGGDWSWGMSCATGEGGCRERCNC